jgi:hypothetical protein
MSAPRCGHRVTVATLEVAGITARGGAAGACMAPAAVRLVTAARIGFRCSAHAPLELAAGVAAFPIEAR